MLYLILFFAVQYPLTVVFGTIHAKKHKDIDFFWASVIPVINLAISINLINFWIKE